MKRTSDADSALRPPSRIASNTARWRAERVRPAALPVCPLNAPPPAFGRAIRTARLVLTPVGWPDLADMVALKRDPGAFGLMLGGVRSVGQATDEMAADVAFWARRKLGIFTIREDGRFLGMTGLHERPDGRGLGLRFSIWPHARGRGVAREAAAAALRFAHDQGEPRVVAVARDSNFASRTILGGIGMRVCGSFDRDDHSMLVYDSLRP